ncbi:hypothetical protein [Nocardia otitidiscaviarum]|uniref:hypothetical protein n=1 Tax=Nocardia otitidiscaviarum TaxID=1823 RepID=UPI0018931FAD|nr:hypothetical protein [Nocardia otitidiscaviarum]MBF6183325.1 hypothetical protein [Nocardia otitidiscaviarum]
MAIAHFDSSWYWPRRSSRAAWCGVVVVVVVLMLGFVTGYGEAVVGALAATALGAVTTEFVQIVNLRNKPRNA